MSYRGKSLKAIREQKNLHLRRISEETRITTWYLAGIEEERFDRFPGRFYFKSFTKEYARSLGLDPSHVVDDLQAAYDRWQGERQSRPSPSRRDSGDPFAFLARLTSRLIRPPEV